MLRKTILLTSLLAAAIIFPNHGAQALERLIKGAPAQVGRLVTPQVTPDGPLTVVDVIVDKTAANAVMARDQAIAEAQRLAFQKLAERNLPPDEYKAFKAPDIKTIAGLVQDFEIRGEQLSSTRYVANFTVRFRDAVRSYVHVTMPEGEIGSQEALQGTDAGEEEQAENAARSQNKTINTQTTVETPVAAGPAKNYLILPYFENMAGKLLLWEDPNPWRAAWQQEMLKPGANGSSYAVPMGDISDVAAGPTDAVWSGDYRAIEKLRRNYRADDVVLAVANKSGAYMTIDMYIFRNGGLLKREVLQPYVGTRSEAEAFAAARGEVMHYLQSPDSVKSRHIVESISKELTGRTPPAEAMSNKMPPMNGAAPAVTTTAATAPVSKSMPGSKTEVEAMMSFNTPATWMELQKRVSALSPPVRLNIRSLSKSGAQFTVRYDGDVNALQQALASKGIALNQPSVEIDRSVLGSGNSGMRPVYGIQLMN